MISGLSSGLRTWKRGRLFLFWLGLVFLGCSRGQKELVGVQVLTCRCGCTFVLFFQLCSSFQEKEKKGRGGWNLFCDIDCIFRVYLREEQLVIPADLQESYFSLFSL